MIGSGYWVPYDAAKALSARFCYPIRFALTPIFGNDFPGLCVEPQSNLWLDYCIDRSIIESVESDVKHLFGGRSQQGLNLISGRNTGEAAARSGFTYISLGQRQLLKTQLTESISLNRKKAFSNHATRSGVHKDTVRTANRSGLRWIRH
jgi:hypothetical protein